MGVKRLMSTNTNYFFVDESGDPTFYNRRKTLMLGKEGCSPILILGFIKTKHPSELRIQLEALRTELENDDYYNEIPSFQKTLKAFHAKDDVPEIRLQVYNLLTKMDFKAEFVVARKKEEIFIKRHKRDENAFYFDIVSKLFERSLHKTDNNTVYFSKKDNKTRQKHFEKAIELAKISFENRYNIEITTKTNVLIQTPTDETCLQIIDYMNWAIYRAFVKQEMRYFNRIKDKVSLLIDIYDFGKYPKSY